MLDIEESLVYIPRFYLNIKKGTLHGFKGVWQWPPVWYIERHSDYIAQRKHHQITWPSGNIIHFLGGWYSDNGLLTHFRLVRHMGNLDLFVWVLTSHLFGAYALSETIGQYNRNLIIKYILFISETYTLIIVNTMTFHVVCFIIIIRGLRY